MLGLIWKRISQFYFQEPISDWRAVNCRQFVQLWRKKLWPNCEKKKKCWKTRSKLPSWEPKLVLKYPHGWQNTLYFPLGWLKLDKLPSWVAKTCANVSYWEPKRAPFFFLFSHPPFKKSLCAPLSQLLHFPAYSFKWNWTFTRFFFKYEVMVLKYIYIFFSPLLHLLRCMLIALVLAEISTEWLLGRRFGTIFNLDEVSSFQFSFICVYLPRPVQIYRLGAPLYSLNHTVPIDNFRPLFSCLQLH